MVKKYIYLQYIYSLSYNSTLFHLMLGNAHILQHILFNIFKFNKHTVRGHISTSDYLIRPFVYSWFKF